MQEKLKCFKLLSPKRVELVFVMSHICQSICSLMMVKDFEPPIVFHKLVLYSILDEFLN